MKHGRANKSRILLLGYVLIFGIYFAIRAVQFSACDTANGEVKAIAWGKFTFGVPPSKGSWHLHGEGHGEYQCPEIHFFYKSSTADTGTVYTVTPQSLSLREYHPGDKVMVIFPKGQAELASIYSPGEFWFTTPYMIYLAVIAGLWTIGFVVVVFKPWQEV